MRAARTELMGEGMAFLREILINWDVLPRPSHNAAITNVSAESNNKRIKQQVFVRGHCSAITAIFATSTLSD